MHREHVRCHVTCFIIKSRYFNFHDMSVRIGPSTRDGRILPPGATPPGKESSMLILTRKLGEKILIGDRIVITVTRLEGSHVRLGVDAPPEVAVFREEIAPRLLPMVLPIA